MDRDRRRLYRAIFAAAAVYNLAFGAWAVLFPLHFFELCLIDPPRYPALWQCLGMVVGVYGLLYAHAAAWPDRGRALIAVGLLGKVCGPVGFVFSAAQGTWPLRTLPLILFNDVVWWIPFGLFLLEGTELARRLPRLAPRACAVLHAAALFMMLAFLLPGTETNPDLGARAAHIEAHIVSWRLGWATWIASALSLLAFYAWWGARCRGPWTATQAVLLAATGYVGDAGAEALYIAYLPAYLSWVGPLGTLLSAGWANAFYTAGGVLLTLRSPPLPAMWRGALWLAWAAGAGMTLCALAGYPPGLFATSAVLFPLLIAWSWCAPAVLGESPGA